MTEHFDDEKDEMCIRDRNSDTIIIASINNDTKEVKLASVYRDTLLDIGNDTYTKAPVSDFTVS